MDLLSKHGALHLWRYLGRGEFITAMGMKKGAVPRRDIMWVHPAGGRERLQGAHLEKYDQTPSFVPFTSTVSGSVITGAAECATSWSISMLAVISLH